MGTLNKKTLSFPKKHAVRGMIAVLAMFVAACGSGDGGNGGTNAPIYPYGSCVNCQGINQPVVLTTVTSTGPNNTMQLRNLQIFGESSRLSMSGYQGPITAQGELVVNQVESDSGNYWGWHAGMNYYSGYQYQPVQSTSCVLNPGVYQVHSVTAGQMGYAKGDVLLNLISTAGGIELRIDGPLTSMQGAQIVGNSLYAKVTVVRVNGINCSSNFYGIFGGTSGTPFYYY